MKSKYLIWAMLPLLTACLHFEKLTPKPELVAKEGQYIELKDDSEHFELSKGDKYVVEFPAPTQDNFYLLLNMSDRSSITYTFGSAFNDDDGITQPIADEAANGALEIAYPVNKSVQKFYWTINSVNRDDLILKMTYRYLPQWRYKFETQHESFQLILQENKVDRTTYENIGGSVSFSNFNFARVMGEIKEKSANLDALYSQLESIERLFPQSILNSADEAYQNYLTLKEDIELEQAFQRNYLATLNLFETERKVRNDMGRFMENVPVFTSFFKNKERYPRNVLNEARRVLEARLDELTPYLNEELKKKTNFSAVDMDVEALNQLYSLSGIERTGAYKKMAAFIPAYNNKARALSTARKELDEMRKSINNLKDWPKNSFFDALLKRLKNVRNTLPVAGFSNHGNYTSLKSTKMLNNAIHSLRNELIRAEDQYSRSAQIIRQLNTLAAAKKYRQMIGVVQKNRDIKFLSKIYSNLDSKSLTEQKSHINGALKMENWQLAENNLRALHQDKQFLNFVKIKQPKLQLVKALEDTLLNRVERVTAKKVDAFLAQNYNKVNDVDALYESPVFKAAWDINFTSGNQTQLAKRKAILNKRLQNLKEITFPKKAIEALYKDFLKNPNNNGVLMARAVVTHGSHYKGKDRKLRNIVGECDPYASKWITKEGAYRKVFAIPVTNNKSGENTYVFRINFRIPTDAFFATWDVNIKLPKEVAKDAGSKAWYDKMTMNKKLLKPEGRFTITAPSSKNNYTVLLAPLEVVKDGDSVFEVQFKHNSFKVFEVSINAQEPILRKN